jgi:AAA domain
LPGGYTERDYIAVAKQRVQRAADMAMYPKLLIYARKKQGKTTFALSAGVDSTLVIDPEEGAVYKRQANPYIWPIGRWEDMQDVYGALRTGKLSPDVLGLGPSKTPFRWVVPDGLTRINNFALHYVRREQEERDLARHPGFIDRRDYGKSGELMKQMLANFHTLKMGVIYTAQERTLKVQTGDDEEDSDQDSPVLYVPDLPDAVRGAVNSLVDVIGRLYVVRTEVDGKPKAVRRLQVGTHERYDTGYRSDYELPEVVRNPTVGKLVKLMQEGAT